MENVLTTKQASEILEISPLRVRQLIRKGRLPAIKFGRDWIISKDDLGKVANRRPGRPKGKNIKKKGGHHGNFCRVPNMP